MKVQDYSLAYSVNVKLSKETSNRILPRKLVSVKFYRNVIKISKIVFSNFFIYKTLFYFAHWTHFCNCYMKNPPNSHGCCFMPNYIGEISLRYILSLRYAPLFHVILIRLAVFRMQFIQLSFHENTVNVFNYLHLMKKVNLLKKARLICLCAVP